MTLILLQAIIQSVASTLYWIGLYVGIRAFLAKNPVGCAGPSDRRPCW
jgi:hypothetical protein